MSVESLPRVEAGPYESPLEHLLHHFERVRLWLQRYLLLYADRQTTSEGSPSHLYVSKKEVQGFLHQRSPEEQNALDALELQLKNTNQQIQLRVEASSLQGVLLPLEEIRASFQLSNDALDLLIATLAPEFEPAFNRAYTHAWCDFSMKRTKAGFLLELLGREPADRERLRRELDNDRPLALYQLIEFSHPKIYGDTAPLIQRFVRVATRVEHYLRGRLTPSPLDMGLFARLIEGTRSIDDVLFDEELKDQVRHLLSSSYRDKKRSLRIFFFGPSGCGKKALAQALASEMSRNVLVLDLDHTPAVPHLFVTLLQALLREATMQSADLYIDHLDAWDDKEKWLSFIQLLGDVLHWYPGTVYFSANSELAWSTHYLPEFVSIQIPYPSAEVQAQLWHRFLPPDVPLAGGLDVPEIVKRYSMSGGGIRGSIHEVLARLRLRGREDQKIYRDELFAAIRNNLKHALGDLAIPVSRAYDWDDLILPEETKEKLNGILNYFNHRSMIMRDWGFGGKLLYGKGLSALFSGPSGTGKTMAAAIIARKLGMEMFQIDLSRVVNKYIGETEKNLGKIFDEASRGQAVLLFDEADSLFAKRTEVRSSTDRYANLEVNYLLQRMEHFEGITIMTTNLESALDEAFTRRIRFRIKFPKPDVETREALWRSMIPVEAPAEERLDLDWLAKDFDMAGGSIKNALIRAAIIAAERGTILSYTLLKEAADKEYQEMGKVVRSTSDEF